jgi:hypothetical protein
MCDGEREFGEKVASSTATSTSEQNGTTDEQKTGGTMRRKVVVRARRIECDPGDGSSQVVICGTFLWREGVRECGKGSGPRKNEVRFLAIQNWPKEKKKAEATCNVPHPLLHRHAQRGARPARPRTKVQRSQLSTVPSKHTCAGSATSHLIWQFHLDSDRIFIFLFHYLLGHRGAPCSLLLGVP